MHMRVYYTHTHTHTHIYIYIYIYTITIFLYGSHTHLKSFWKRYHQMCANTSCLRIFSESSGSKSGSRPWRLSRHVPASAITDRWDESPCQAWMETGGNHCIMDHLIHPTHTQTPTPADSCPSGRITDSETLQMSVLLPEILTASSACLRWVECFSSQFECVCTFSFIHQQMFGFFGGFFVWMEDFLLRLCKQVLNE